MFVTLIRHGNAEPEAELGDEGRFLSVLGRTQARATGEALAAMGVSPTRVWCSPLVRAVQTAELVAAALGFAGAIETRDDLYPQSSPGALLADLEALGEDSELVAVGHMPYMPAMASALLGYSVSGFATGAAYRIELREWTPAGPRSELAWRWMGGVR
jgi:phosphohistidine phosphatase